MVQFLYDENLHGDHTKKWKPHLHLPDGCKFEIQMQYGSIGWSVGAFLGLVAASPERRVIGLIGDGSFQMTAQEVSTCLRYNYSESSFS